MADVTNIVKTFKGTTEEKLQQLYRIIKNPEKYILEEREATTAEVPPAEAPPAEDPPTGLPIER